MKNLRDTISKEFSRALRVLVLAALVLAGATLVGAAPSAPPPANPFEVINAGSSPQTKVGGFSVATQAGKSLVVGTGVGTNVALVGGNVAAARVTTGSYTLPTGAQAGYVLTSDAAGNASWQAPSAPLPSGNCTPVPSTFSTVNFVEVGSISTSNLDGPYSVAICDTFAYVAAAISDGLVVIDVSNPANPQQIAFLSNSYLDAAVNVLVSPTHAFVRASSRLTVVDITNHANMGVTDSLGFGGNGIHNIARSGNYVYAALFLSDEFKSIDVSDPANIFVADSAGGNESCLFCLPPHDSNPLDLAHDVEISGNYAYVTSVKDLLAFDISNPANLNLVKKIAISDGPWEVAISGNYAYVVGGETLTVVDISDPANMNIVGSAAIPSAHLGYNNATKIVVASGYAFVSDSNARKIMAFNIVDPANITLVRTITSPNFSGLYDFAISGNYMYVPMPGADRLTIYRIQ